MSLYSPLANPPRLPVSWAVGSAAPDEAPTRRPADTGFLCFHSLIEPPLPVDERADGSPDALARHDGVWTPLWEPVEGHERWLAPRHLRLQALQWRLQQLVNESSAQPWNPMLRLFAGGKLEHLYVGHAEFEQLATRALALQGEPARLPSFIDVQREWVVIDASRFFLSGGDRLSPAAWPAVVAMSESPHFVSHVLRSLQHMREPAELYPACREVRRLARLLMREALGEPGLELPPAALQARDRLGSQGVVRALLCGVYRDAVALSDELMQAQPLWQSSAAAAGHRLGTSRSGQASLGLRSAAWAMVPVA